MKVLALDLSTSSGVSIFIDGKLKDYTVIKRKVKGNTLSENYPINYIEMAECLALKIGACASSEKPDFIVIEETNKGKERFRQKQLEFIHFAVGKFLNELRTVSKLNYKIKYIDSSAWRKILGLSLDSDQRSSNKERKKGRDIKREEISKTIYEKLASQIESEVEGLKKRETNKIIKRWDREINKLVGQEMKKFRSSIKNVDHKTLSVNYVNEVFNLGFKRSQNDIADSICVGYAFIKNNYNTKISS